VTSQLPLLQRYQSRSMRAVEVAGLLFDAGWWLLIPALVERYCWVVGEEVGALDYWRGCGQLRGG